MAINSFWLFYIEEDSVLVSLINWGNGRFFIASIGPRVTCDITNHQSILQAADQSLSSAATSADIPPEEEPIFVGLVVPSSWVGEEGKIDKSKMGIILPLLKDLDLKPTGFMSNDEAIIEEANKPDEFPASFINIYLGNNYFELSIVYLGKIKTRILKSFDGEFTPQLVEDCLLELNSESTLPPQIYIYGKADESTVEDLKNFAWVGKKNVETFLHFPDIKLYQDPDLISIFFKAITSQMIGGGDSSHQSVPPLVPEETEAVSEQENEIEESEKVESISEPLEPEEHLEELEEISSENLGFTKDVIGPEITEPPILETPTVEATFSSSKPPISLQLPKINFQLPKLKFNFLIFILPAVLVLFLFFLLFSKANIVLFVTPYDFNKTVNITLDSNATDLTSLVIPVNQKTLTVNASATVKTTGQKTVGDKATGEITIFNKLDKVQKIPQGSILVDSNGQKFETVSAVQVAASVTNYDSGTMNFGQTKTTVSASDIGPEYNISKDTALTFKDFSTSSIVVKNDANFSGGTKTQINAVSEQDKTNAQSQLDQNLTDAANKKISETFSNANDVIKETIQIKKSKAELNREVGEETDELTASAQSDVSVLALKPELKSKILTQFLSKEANFSDANITPDSFVFTLKIDKLEATKATGSLTITGSSLPKINTESLKKSIAGKTIKNAQQIIKKTISRVYDFNIQTNFKMINILPFNSKNILFDIKTETK